MLFQEDLVWLCIHGVEANEKLRLRLQAGYQLLGQLRDNPALFR